MRTIRMLSVSLAMALLIGLGELPAVPQAAASVQSDFIAKIVNAAQQNERKTGIPASVTIAQAALETGWGRSRMAQSPINSYFSIKCGSSSPHASGCTDVSSLEYDRDGKPYVKVSSFRTYDNPGDSLLDYGRLLTGLARYQSAFAFTKYPDQFISEVHKAGYATDPRYTEIVVLIMGKYSLYQYNVGGGRAGAPPADLLPELRYGARGDYVKTLQSLLNSRNNAKLKVDGVFTGATQSAVRNWQQKLGLAVTGVVNRATWNSLRTPAPASPKATPTSSAKPKATPSAKPKASPATSSFPTLKQGSRGESVKTLQRLLNSRNNAKLQVDGAFGPITKAKVRAWQKKAGIPVTGVVNYQTWRSLLPKLRYGSRGASTKALQYELRAAGLSVPPIGIFGPQTRARVRAFQKAHGLKVTGIVDFATWGKLLSK